MASTRDSGNRIEIVLLEGFSSGKKPSSTLEKSMYSVESWLAQKFSSSVADLNLGIFLSFLAIDLSFPSAHSTSRDDANFRSTPCEDNKEHALIVSLPEQIIPLFIARVRSVCKDIEGLVEEHFFTLPPGHFVPTPVLLTIRLMPHPYFQRRGNHLLVRVPITLSEAVMEASAATSGESIHI